MQLDIHVGSLCGHFFLIQHRSIFEWYVCGKTSGHKPTTKKKTRMYYNEIDNEVNVMYRGHSRSSS